MSSGVEAEEPEADVLEVLAENWQAVEVFGHCQMTWVGSGMGGMFATGIAALEAQAAIQALGITEQAADVFAQATAMERKAANALNGR